MLKENHHKYRRIEADENAWDRATVLGSQDEDQASEPAPARPSSPAQPSREDVGIPVYVMLPLDTIQVTTDAEGRTCTRITNEMALELALHTLREAGVTVRPPLCHSPTLPERSEHVAVKVRWWQTQWRGSAT